MQRLARVAEGEAWEAAGEGLYEAPGLPDDRKSAALSAGIGAFAGTLLAGTTLLGVLTLAQERSRGDGAALAAEAIMAGGAVAPELAPAAPARAEASQPATFDIVIDRSEQAHAPFGLRLAGAADADLEIVLRDVPPAAGLSRGERRGASTWAVKSADLGELRLALHDGVPDAFELRIDVMAPPGMAAVPSVARVRLIGSPTPAGSTAAIAEEPVLAPVRTAAHAGSGGKGGRAPRRVQPTVADAGASAAQAAVPQPRPWPEGASALGATSRGEWARQVWWQMPPPAWSPFQVPAGQR